MKLEVIIPAYKPDNKLNSLIFELRRQRIVPNKMRILLTTNSSKEVEDLHSLLGHDICVEQVLPSDFRHGRTRQYGMNTSEAEYVLFMTQDAVPADIYLTENMLATLNDEKCAAVYARQLPNSDASEVEKYTRTFNYPEESHIQSQMDIKTKGIKTIFCSDSCMMYNKKLHIEIGGFEEDTNFNEDSIFAYNAIMKGYNIQYNSSAKVYHSHNFTLRQNFKRSKDIARCQKEYSYIYNSFPSEKEGKRYFSEGVRFFKNQHKPIEIIKLFINCSVRYMGYFVGKHC